MTYYFISDLHVDFYAPMTRTVAMLRKHFEIFFERNFLPADACCIAGDIANDYFTYVEFLKFIAEKYDEVYVCLGNHDIITEHLGRFGSDRDFTTSESKIDYFIKEADKIPNIQLLENRIAGDVAGCMGMCDFKYKHSPAASEIANKILWATRWFDGRHWKYMQNNTDKLWRHYNRAFRELTARRPKIMMSHFLPLEFEMAERYKHDPYSNFFFTSTMPNTSKIWMMEVYGRRVSPTPPSSASTPTGLAKSTYCSAIPSATLTRIPTRNTG